MRSPLRVCCTQATTMFCVVTLLAACAAPPSDSTAPTATASPGDRQAAVDKDAILHEIYGEDVQLHLPELYAGAEGDRFRSEFLDAEVMVAPGVFMPYEAEAVILPFMAAHAELFRGKTVLEIGAGSGINALFAARLGATRVIATDISQAAVGCIADNARRLGFENTVEARLVPADDTSAYSVLAPTERVHTVLSNPPFAIDLDAAHSTAQSESGSLGFSLLHQLPEHLEPGGCAALYYGSDFYHLVMVKYARHLGYDVNFARPTMLMPWEMETLYNQTLRTILGREGVAKDAFSFNWRRDGLRGAIPEAVRPAGQLSPGWMIITP